MLGRSKESGEQGPVGNILCSREGIGILRGGSGAGIELERRWRDEVYREGQNNNFKQ